MNVKYFFLVISVLYLPLVWTMSDADVVAQNIINLLDQGRPAAAKEYYKQNFYCLTEDKKCCRKDRKICAATF